MAERYRLPISPRTRLQMVATLLVLLVGVTVAGLRARDDDGSSSRTATAAPASATPTTVAATPTTAAPTTVPAVAPTTVAPPTTQAATASSPVTAASGTGAGTSAVTGSGSSGTGAAASAEPDGLASTGGLPLAVPGGILVGLALLSRRLSAR